MTNGIFLTPNLSAASDSFVRHDLTIEERPIDETPKLRVIVVGAGITGVTAAVLLPIKVPGVDLVIYERDSDVVNSSLPHHKVRTFS